MSVHICRPATVWLRAYHHCPNCNRRRRFVGMCQVWYDTLWTCCACGDSYSGAEGRMERPFARGWRAEATARARCHWAEAPTRREAREQLDALLHEAIA